MRRMRAGAGSDNGSPRQAEAEVNGALPARQRGRPRELDGPGVSLSVWLPVGVYDWLTREAERRKQSVSAYAREVFVIIANVRDR